MTRRTTLILVVTVAILGIAAVTVTSCATPGVRVGQRAPDFELTADDGTTVRLREELGGHRSVVLFFYAADGTPG